MIRYLLDRPDFAHPWLFERAREVEASPNGHLDLWARDHRKSTTITFALTIQDILSSHGENPLPKWNGIEPSFGIFSHTRPIAKGFLRHIKNELEKNETLKTLFPDVLYWNPKAEAPKWSEDDGLVVKRRTNQRESTIEAWGLVDGQPTGKHFYVRVYDDIVTFDSTHSDVVSKKVTAAWELSQNLGQEQFVGSEDPGIERYVGTRYADSDTYGEMLARASAEPRIYPATEDGMEAGKPVLLSKKVLAKKRRDMGFATFNAQMLLDPIQSETAFFKKEWIRYYSKLPTSLAMYISFDSAVEEGKGDYTDIGVWGVDPGDNLYAVDWWYGQKSTHQWVEALINLMLLHQPLKVLGEKGLIEKAVSPFLTKRMHERRAYFSLEWLPTMGKKDAKATSFQGRMEHGKVLWPTPSTAPWVERVLRQLLRFPHGLHDDGVDACSHIGRHLQTLVGAPRGHRLLHEFNPGYVFSDEFDEDGNRLEADWKLM